MTTRKNNVCHHDLRDKRAKLNVLQNMLMVNLKPWNFVCHGIQISLCLDFGRTGSQIGGVRFD